MGRGAGALIAFALCAGAAAADCGPARLSVQGASAQATFTIELADDPAEQQVGLMNRPEMPLGAGMLFAFPTPKRAQFWMANTLIPLDMLFAGPDGRISHIHENAVPLDTTTIDGGEGVQFVLEINGGLARRMGIALGDQIRHPAIAGSCDTAPE